MSMDQMVAGFQRQAQDTVAKMERPRSENKRDYTEDRRSQESQSFSDAVRDVHNRDAQEAQKSAQNNSRNNARTDSMRRSDPSAKNEVGHRDDTTATTTTQTDSENTATSGLENIDDIDDNAVAAIDPLAVHPELAGLLATMQPDLEIGTDLAAIGESATPLATGTDLKSMLNAGNATGDNLPQQAQIVNPQNIVPDNTQGQNINSHIGKSDAEGTALLSTSTDSNSSQQQPHSQQESSLLDQQSQLSQQQNSAVGNNNNDGENDAESGDEPARNTQTSTANGHITSSSQNATTTGINISGFSTQLDDVTGPTAHSKSGQIHQGPANNEANAMDKAVAKQVDRALTQSIGNNQRVVQLRLTPPELGTIRIEILENNGRLSVRLHAEDDSVRAALERSLPQLRQDIRGGDTPVSTIDLTDSSFLMGHDRQTQQQQQWQQWQQQNNKKNNGSNFQLDGFEMPGDVAETISSDIGITVDAHGVHGVI